MEWRLSTTISIDKRRGNRRGSARVAKPIPMLVFWMGKSGRHPAECEAEIDEIVRWRRANQPGGSNAGSVFTNPPGDTAGRLIDACGLKRLRVGGVRVSERHANFFQADPGARAADVVALVLEVQRRVESASGVRLHPELRPAGFAGQPGSRPGAPPAWTIQGACR